MIGFDFEQNHVKSNTINSINGLSYVPNFISDLEHKDIWETINDQEWITDLNRRTQHYGYKYDYKRRSLDHTMYLGEIPEWIKNISDKILESGYMKIYPDQVIINEYLPGQGIADHVDCEPCFDDTIISLSLGSPCIMNFKKIDNFLDKRELLLEPKSLLIIEGDARYRWTHGISPRKKDRIDSIFLYRRTRISLTFRKVIKV